MNVHVCRCERGDEETEQVSATSSSVRVTSCFLSCPEKVKRAQQMGAVTFLLLLLLFFYICRKRAGVMMATKWFFNSTHAANPYVPPRLHFSRLQSLVHVPSHTLAQLQRPQKTTALVKTSLKTAITLLHPPSSPRTCFSGAAGVAGAATAGCVCTAAASRLKCY